MSDKREKTASLLRRLAEGRRIDEAATDLDLPVDSARRVLRMIADQYAPADLPPAPADLPPAPKGESAVAYIDGGARGNPGPAGCGVLIRNGRGEKMFSTSRFLGKTTNNVAEYNGLLTALESALKLNVSVLEIRSDSQLLVEQMSGRYKVKARNLIPLFLSAQRLARQFKKVVYTHVPREQNCEADRLANEAMDTGAKRPNG